MSLSHTNRCPRCGDALLAEDTMCARSLAESLFPELMFDSTRSKRAMDDAPEVRVKKVAGGEEMGAHGGNRLDRRGSCVAGSASRVPVFRKAVNRCHLKRPFNARGAARFFLCPALFAPDARWGRHLAMAISTRIPDSFRRIWADASRACGDTGFFALLRREGWEWSTRLVMKNRAGWSH